MDWILQYLVAPETIRAASFCTDSMSDFCYCCLLWPLSVTTVVCYDRCLLWPLSVM